MNRTIGIIAPLIDTRQYNMDFTIRLAANSRELTLATFYELANEGYIAENVSRGIDYGEDIPAAGFYLEGLLHQLGYDTFLTNQYDAETLKTIADKDPFAVCVSTTMIIATDSLLDLCSSIRSAMPGTHIIAGGMFVWKNYLQYLKHQGFPRLYPLEPTTLFHANNARIDLDILVVAPHGKSSLVKVLEELEKGRRASFEEIPNLCIPGEHGFSFTKREEEQVNYDEDYTRWDLIKEMPFKVPIRTSIGCPFRCRFCDFCQLFHGIFLRSKSSLSQELKLVKNRLGQNLAVIHVSDDNVFINKKRLFDVCNTIADSGLNHWIGFMRGGEYSDDEMDAIVRSGLMMGKIGVESGDQGQLNRMNKRQKVENVKRGIEQLDAHGIGVLMTFVVGFPGETQQTLRNTADFLNNLSLTNLSVGYQVYPLVIFPLSELAESQARKEWKIEGMMEKWSHFTMESDDAVKACYDLFKEVSQVPYSYSEESYFFNRGMFDLETRRSLFQLRQQLTVKLMEKAPWDEIGPVMKRMAVMMEVSPEGIGESLRGEIIVPGIGF